MNAACTVCFRKDSHSCTSRWRCETGQKPSHVRKRATTSSRPARRSVGRSCMDRVYILLQLHNRQHEQIACAIGRLLLNPHGTGNSIAEHERQKGRDTTKARGSSRTFGPFHSVSRSASTTGSSESQHPASDRKLAFNRTFVCLSQDLEGFSLEFVHCWSINSLSPAPAPAQTQETIVSSADSGKGAVARL